MDDKKIVIDGLSAQDYEILETRFKTMANEGLLIEDMKFKLSFYKKIQPKDIEFAVGIYPKAKAFDKPDERVVYDYVEAQKEKGWDHVFSRDYTHVFMNEDKKVIKDIDRTNQAENIKSILRPEIFSILFAMLINIFGLATNRGIDTYHFMSNFALVSLVIMPAIIIAATMYLIYDIFRYVRLSRIHSNDEIQIEDITGILVLRKIWSVFVAVFIAILLISLLADSLISGSRVVLWFIPVIIIIFAVYKLRVFFPEMSLGTTAKTWLALVGLFLLALIMSTGGIFTTDGGFGVELPQGYTALKLEDIGVKKDPEHISFNREGSILMPLSYNYREESDPRRRSEISVYTQVNKVINEELADYIFRLEKESSTRYFGKIISAKDYYPDYNESYFLDYGDVERQVVKLQKGVYIFTFSGEIDLEEASNIELVNDKVDKIITDFN